MSMEKVPLTSDQPSALAAGGGEAQLNEAIDSLRHSGDLYRSLIYDLQVGVLIQLANSEIVLSNPRAWELLGLTQDQLTGKTSLDPEWNVIHPDGTPFPGHTHPVPRAIARRAPIHNVVMGVYRPATGDRVWLLVNADPQISSDGNVLKVVCTFSDISQACRLNQELKELDQLQRTQEIFQEREAFAKSVLNSISSEIAVVARNGSILAVNEAWRRFASENRAQSGELPAKTGVGANYLDVSAADDDKSVEGSLSPADGIKAILEGKLRSYSHEYPCHSPDQQRWFHMHATPFENTKILGAVVTHTDITSRKLAELKHERSDAELKLAQHCAHIGSWHWDKSTDVTSASEELCRIFGVAAMPKFADQRGYIYSEQTWQILNAEVQKAVATGIGYNLDLPAIRSDGTPLWINTRSVLALNDKNEVVGLHGTVQDITEHKIALQQLSEMQERLQLVIEATDEGIWDWHVPSGRVFRSERYLALVGADADQDTGDFDFFKRTVHADDLANVLRCIEDHKVGRSPGIQFEYRLAKKSNIDKWMKVKGKIVSRDSNGLPTRILGTLADITDRKIADISLREREQQLARVLSGSKQGFWEFNVQTHAAYIDTHLAGMLGYEPSEMNPAMEHWGDYIHPQDLDLITSAIESHITGNSTSTEIELRIKAKTGEWKWFLYRGQIVSWDDSGKPLIISGTQTDITDRKQFDSANQEAAAVFSSSFEGIMVVSPELLVTKVNPAFTRITGYPIEEVIDQSPKLLSSNKHDSKFYQELWATVNSVGMWTGEIWDRRKNGVPYAALLTLSCVRSESNSVLHYVGVFSDISKFKEHEVELDRITHYDPLTGAPNRRLLSDRLENAINRARMTDRKLAVCFLDIDNFKLINGDQGTSVGDQVLIGVAENLRGILRTDDTLARVGGDEFVLLLSGISSNPECLQILERVQKALTTPVSAAGTSIAITASIGVSLFPDDNADADTLLRHADQAMYQAKEAGKNRYCFFDLVSNQKAQAHRSYLDLLKTALLEDQFELHYQPKVNLRSGEIVGAEALIRWRRPGVGLVFPADFLPHIYGSDIEVPLGDWVIKNALAQLAEWRRSGFDLCVSVNISPHHLLNSGFYKNLVQALALHPDLPASCFELEVLETAAIADINLAIEILTQCRQLGIKFSLDDFGTGYSSLTYLRKLPIDTLKIDQSFVRDMLNDAEDFGIVQGVIQLGEVFKKKIVAEGVETLNHGAALLGMNCWIVQGYGIARPMQAIDFAEWSISWTESENWVGLTIDG